MRAISLLALAGMGADKPEELAVRSVVRANMCEALAPEAVLRDSKLDLFLLGMFSRGARSLGVSVGAVCGVLMVFVWGFGHDLGWFEKPLGYGWTSTVGFVTTVVCCTVVSMIQRVTSSAIGRPAPTDKLDYLWRNVMSGKTAR